MCYYNMILLTSHETFNRAIFHNYKKVQEFYYQLNLCYYQIISCAPANVRKKLTCAILQTVL